MLVGWLIVVILLLSHIAFDTCAYIKSRKEAVAGVTQKAAVLETIKGRAFGWHQRHDEGGTDVWNADQCYIRYMEAQAIWELIAEKKWPFRARRKVKDEKDAS